MWGTSIHDMNTGHIGQGIKTRSDFRDHPSINDAFIDQCLGLRLVDFCKVSAISKVNAIYVAQKDEPVGFKGTGKMGCDQIGINIEARSISSQAKRSDDRELAKAYQLQ